MTLRLSPKQKNNYSVYIHTNKTNGKVYIGITKQVPERRWQNGHGYDGTYKGYVWEYADKHYKKPANVGIGNYDHSKRRKPVAVVFPDGTKKNFSCVKEASEMLGVNYNTARRYAIDNAVDKEGRRWGYES